MITQFKTASSWPVLAVALLVALALVSLTDAQSSSAQIKGGEILAGRAAPQAATSTAKEGGPVAKMLLEDSSGLLFGAVSPDGRKLAYVRIVPKTNGQWTTALEVTNFVSGAVVRLIEGTSGANTQRDLLASYPPVWSPKGDRLAFGLRKFDFVRSNLVFTVGIVPASGGPSQIIYPAGSPLGRAVPLDWSKDGKWILMVGYSSSNRTTHLMLLPAAGGEPKELASFPGNLSTPFNMTRNLNQTATRMQGRISPDGKLVAYMGTNEAGSSLFLLNVDSLSQTKVAPFHTSAGMQCWSGDGRFLLFVNKSELWAQRIENTTLNGDAVLIKRDIGLGARLDRVLDDGKLAYVYIRSGFDSPAIRIFRVEVDQESGQVRGEPTFVAEGRNPVPSRDGKLLAYVTGGNNPLTGNLHVVSSDGRVEKSLPAAFGNSRPVDWWPDGKSLLVVSGAGTNGRRFRLDINSGESQQLSEPAPPSATGDGLLSPDGLRIAFYMRSGPQTNKLALYLADAEPNAKPVLLRHDPNENSSFPSWSPDGRFILFEGWSVSSASGKTNLYVNRLLIIPTVGGEAKELLRIQDTPTESYNLWTDGWHGEYVYYTREVIIGPSDVEEYWRVKGDGSNPTLLRKSTEDDRRADGTYRWPADGTLSADGKTMYFLKDTPAGTPADAAGVGSFWTLANFLPQAKPAAK